MFSHKNFTLNLYRFSSRRGGVVASKAPKINFQRLVAFLFI